MWVCECFSIIYHKPLAPLFSTKRLEELPVSVQWFRIRTLRFHFFISHVPGKDLVIADVLSRAPDSTPSEQDLLLEEDTRAFIEYIMDSLPASEIRLKEIAKEQKNDPVCAKIAQYCTKGWPDKASLSVSLKQYHSLLSDISIVNGLLMRNSRIIIPSKIRQQVLNQDTRGSLNAERWLDFIERCHSCRVPRAES